MPPRFITFTDAENIDEPLVYIDPDAVDIVQLGIRAGIGATLSVNGKTIHVKESVYEVIERIDATAWEAT